VVVFDFRMGREREGPKRFLGDFEGILQSDGYVAYDHVGGPNIVHAACWAHARRKFFQAVELNPKDQSAIRIVAQCPGARPRFKPRGSSGAAVGKIEAAP
jgi:transposase